MQNKEITLTAKELEVLKDRTFLKVKQEATEKIVNLFSELRHHIDEIWQQKAWENAIPCQKNDVKISKGENYRQLPYVMLDYPRKFTREDIFAFRSMFWWGHFFSFTLHLQGKSLEQNRPTLALALKNMPSETDFFLCVAEKPWEYHYKTDNYKPLASMSHSEIEAELHRKNFVKISSWIPITADTQQVIQTGKQKFQDLMALILDS